MVDEKYQNVTISNSNAVGPLGAFAIRGIYAEVYPEAIPPFDFYEKKNILYGRIDDKNNTVHVNEFYLKQINSTKSENIFCINFVADAFEDFRYYLKTLSFARLKKDQFLTTDWDAFTAWDSPHNFYDGRMNDLYKVYVKGNLSLKNNENLIKNVDDFLEMFLNDFYPSMNKNMPITKSGLISSKYYNPTNTGMCIEISDVSHSQDSVKLDRFLKSPNFEFYVLAAAKYGFLIDKNAPWRLVANLNSPAMKSYMQRYGLSLNNVFDIVYVKTYKYDIQNLKEYIKQMYVSFLNISPNFTKKSPTYDNEKCPKYLQAQTISVPRAPLDSIQYDTKYNDLFWLKLYYRLKLDEINTTQSNFLLTKELEEIQQIYNSLDFEQTLDYINDRIKSQTS
jgi:hypothetical protein